MILCVGDSFCADDDEGTWPFFLETLLQQKVITIAKKGCSWWTHRNDLITFLQTNDDIEIDVVIFCHTECTRLPNVEHAPINNFSVQHSTFFEPNIAKAARLYYQYLYDPEFARWSQQRWIDECNSYFTNKTYCIHLHSFPYSATNCNIEKNLNIKTPLFAISVGEFDSTDEFQEFNKVGDLRKNHLSFNNNKILAEQLYKLIRTKPSGDIELDLTCFSLKNYELALSHVGTYGDIILDGKKL